MASAEDLVKLAKDEGVEAIDFRFCDLVGQQQHYSMPTHRLTVEAIEDGYGFDGSSVRGFKAINESDMLLVPDPNTAWIDPFFAAKTLNVVCDINDPVTGEAYNRDPRGVARRVGQYLSSTGIADTAYIGPEAEFFVFDAVQVSNRPDEQHFKIWSDEGAWATGYVEDPNGQMNQQYKPGFKGGYFPVPPVDHYQDLRGEMVRHIENAGIEVELHHHEVGTAGQAEIDVRFDTLLRMADNILTFKYIVRQTAMQAGKTATFMPKPLYGDNGSGMHTHQSLWKGGEPLFFDADGYGQLSQMALYYIGGLLKHAPAILAFSNPTVNSYKRLVPGYEAPVSLAYSARNRSASIRIPMLGNSPKAKRLEFRCPDPTANPYLAFSAMIMAGLDGIQNKIDPGAPLDKNLYDLAPEELADIPQVPGSLEGALDALAADSDFLLAGGVFDQDTIDAYIDFKRSEEVDPHRLRPTPFEMEMYYSY